MALHSFSVTTVFVVNTSTLVSLGSHLMHIWLCKSLPLFALTSPLIRCNPDQRSFACRKHTSNSPK